MLQYNNACTMHVGMAMGLPNYIPTVDLNIALFEINSIYTPHIQPCMHVCSFASAKQSWSLDRAQAMMRPLPVLLVYSTGVTQKVIEGRHLPTCHTSKLQGSRIKLLVNY